MKYLKWFYMGGVAFATFGTLGLISSGEMNMWTWLAVIVYWVGAYLIETKKK